MAVAIAPSLAVIPDPPPMDGLLKRKAKYRVREESAPDAFLDLVVPVPPPIPKEWSRKLRAAEDNDSGHGSAVDLTDLPGSDLSDDEFSELFPSRRGSASSIPYPPPPPPIPAYLRNVPLLLIRQLSMHAEQQYAESDEISLNLNPFGDYGHYDGDYMYDTEICTVCYANASQKRYCCNQHVCRECMVNMVIAKVVEGLIYIQCPNPACDTPLGRTEILGYLGIQPELKERYERMRLEADGDDSKKACPNCCHITEHEVPSGRFRKFQEEDVRIHCQKCAHDWCFRCHAPWHSDISCKQFQRGDRQFYSWTKARSGAGIANCQKCPLCRVYIQRSTGCDHMTCNRCDTHFCYKCGGRFTSIPGLGDHYTQTSVIGCKFNYKANNPVQRKAIRGSYLGAKLAMLTGYPFLFVGGVVVFLVAGAVVLPIYGGYKLYKFRKNTNRLYRRRRRN